MHKIKLSTFLNKYHPFIVAILPPIFLAVHNIHEVYLSDAITACVVLLVVVGILYKILQFFIKDPYLIAPILSTCIILFFIFGPLQYQLTAAEGYLAKDSLAITACVYLPFLIIVFVYNFINKKFASIYNTLLANVSLVFLILSGYNLITNEYFGYYLQQTFSQKSITSLEKSLQKPPANLLKPLANNSKTDKPDVYFIILDGYLRSDMLKSMYGYDNSKFINQMEKLGFYFAEKSASNYPMTHLSLASTLNMEYLDTEINKYGNVDFRPYYKLIQNPRVAQIFKSNGYKYFTFASGWDGTKFASKISNQHFSTLYNRFSDYQQNLILMTPFRFLEDYSEADLILSNINKAKLISKNHLEPKFMFIHLRVPHPPHSFDKNGHLLPILHKHSYTVKGYKEEIQFTNQMIVNFLENIIKNSNKTPVIFLQSDHGSHFSILKYHYQQVKLSLEDKLIKERYSILNASFGPKNFIQQLPKDLTSVNTFRYLFNYLGFTDLPILENKQYFLWHNTKTPMVDVTNRYQQINNETNTHTSISIEQEKTIIEN